MNPDLHNLHIIESIRKRLKLRKVLTIVCIGTLVLGFSSFLFYGFETNSTIIKFISSKEDLVKVEKVMMNPKIKYEHEDGEIFDIVAKKVVHKNKTDVELSDVKANGAKGNIEAGNLLITNNGNDLHFSGNPVLTIREVSNDK